MMGSIFFSYRLDEAEVTEALHDAFRRWIGVDDLDSEKVDNVLRRMDLTAREDWTTDAIRSYVNERIGSAAPADNAAGRVDWHSDGTCTVLISTPERKVG